MAARGDEVGMIGILTYHSIDPSGSAISLDEACFRRHVDWLASSETVAGCVTHKYMTYALAGGEAVEDECLTRDVTREFEASGGSLRGLMRSIALHPRFNGVSAEEQ